jgi:hypothetical protein
MGRFDCMVFCIGLLTYCESLIPVIEFQSILHFYQCKQNVKSLGIHYPVLNFYRLCNYNHTLYLNNRKNASKH